MSAGYVVLSGPVRWPDGRSTTVEVTGHAIVCDHDGCLAAHVEGGTDRKSHEINAACDSWLLRSDPSADYCPEHRAAHLGDDHTGAADYPEG